MDKIEQALIYLAQEIDDLNNVSDEAGDQHYTEKQVNLILHPLDDEPTK
jgi:hypothetical protein